MYTRICWYILTIMILWSNFAFAQQVSNPLIPTNFTPITIYQSKIPYISVTEVTWASLSSTHQTASTWQADSSSGIDLSIIYARKIESLIEVKWQDTRLTMLSTINKFLTNYDSSQPLYSILTRIVAIIKLGEVSHKLEYCTQFDDAYYLTLFGKEITIHSAIKYDSTSARCTITFAYPDGSVHSCALSDVDRDALAWALEAKQGLTSSTTTSFESMLSEMLTDKICYESVAAQVITNTRSWSIVWDTATTSWANNEDSTRRRFNKK